MTARGEEGAGGHYDRRVLEPEGDAGPDEHEALVPFVPGAEIKSFSLQARHGDEPDWLTMDVSITVDDHRGDIALGTLTLSKAYATESGQWTGFPLTVLQIDRDQPLIDQAKLDDAALWAELTDDEKEAVAEVVAFFDNEPEAFLTQLGDTSDESARRSLAKKAAVGAAAVGVVATVVGITWRVVRARRSDSG